MYREDLEGTSQGSHQRHPNYSSPLPDRLLSLFTRPSCPSTVKVAFLSILTLKSKTALLQGGNVSVREDREDRLWLIDIQHVNFGSLYLDMYS